MSYFTDKQVKKFKDGYVLTEEDMKDKTPLTIPNTNDLKKQILELLEFATSDEMLQLRDINTDEYKKLVRNKFPLFPSLSLMELILKGEPIDNLGEMLERFDAINRKEITHDKAFFQFDKGMAQKHILPNMKPEMREQLEKKILEKELYD